MSTPRELKIPKADEKIDIIDGIIIKSPSGAPISAPWASSPPCRGFGDYSGLQIVISRIEGQLWVKTSDGPALQPLKESSPFARGIQHVAIAGNGKVCIVKGEYRPSPLHT